MAALSYLAIHRLSGEAFMGGLMTVNELGLPTEFIYSEPLTPTKLQVSLYGTTLGRYIMLDVVGKGLLDASQARGVPVVVGHGDLLPLATRVKRPICQLTATAQRALGDTGQIREQSGEEFLVQLSEVQSPHHFRVHDRAGFPIEQHLPLFIECASRFDLLEPLARISRTLELIKDGAAQ